MLEGFINRFEAFRNVLPKLFPSRSGALSNSVDALAGNQHSPSPPHITSSDLFPRSHNSLYDGIDNFFKPKDVEQSGQERLAKQCERLRLLTPFLPVPQKHPFWLLATDATPAPRPFSKTLEDRGIVYLPNPAPGNKPIVVGHRYSAVVILPEKEGSSAPPWVVPLSIQRVPTAQTETQIAAQQVNALLNDEQLPFHDDLVVQVADSAYSSVRYLSSVASQKNLVVITRVRGNRTFYNQPPPCPEKRGRGRPKWYGDPFKLADDSTWRPPDQEASYPSPKHPDRTVKVKVWFNILMRGKRGAPMHKYPFTLHRFEVLKPDGTPVYKRPLWLIAFGERRIEVSPEQVDDAYAQRYDVEHFFRFGKQRLLMDDFQTPDVTHEENWWELVGLAYFQLRIAAPLAESLPYPWERYLPDPPADQLANPSRTQRDLPRIISQLEATIPSPKPRGKSPGRKKGRSPGRREQHPTIIKKALPPKAQAPPE